MGNPIYPHVLNGPGGTKDFRVTLQNKSLDGKAYTVPRQAMPACKDELGLGRVTRDGALTVFVTECVYPGGKDEPVSNKWIYVTTGKTLIAEAHAIEPMRWRIGYHPDALAEAGSRTLGAKSKGFFRLKRGKRDKPIRYGFFISPIQLSARALKQLLKHAEEPESVMVTRAFPQHVGAVAVPDCWRWARDAHRLFFQPALDEYQNWVFNPERNAKVFIGSVLKGWMENDDPAGVRKLVAPGEPDIFLANYRKTELALREVAETAAAYLAECVQAPEHQIIDYAAQEEAEGFAFGVCHYAAVTCRITETEPGRQLAVSLAADNSLVPRKYIFTDKNKAPGFEFAEWRFSWLAALGIFQNLFQAVFESLKMKKLHAHMDATPDYLLIRKYLKHLGVATLEGVDRTVWRKVQKPKKWKARFSGLRPSSRKALKTGIEKLLQGSEEFEKELALASKLDGYWGKTEKIHAAFEPWCKAFVITAGTVIEACNLFLAIDELHRAKKEKGDKLIAVIGSSADMMKQLLDLIEMYMVKRAGKELEGVALRRIVGVGGVLGLVSGACDMHDFLNKSDEAMTQRDYGRAVGNELAAAGAATVIVGGGLALAWSLSGGVLFASAAGGPAGLAIGAIGSVLVFGGCVIAAWFSDNQFQSFAKFCCFRANRENAYMKFPWALEAIGFNDSLGEARVLRKLISNFVVERVLSPQHDSTTYITIKPGYAPQGARFEISYNLCASGGRSVGDTRYCVEIGDSVSLIPANATNRLWAVVQDPKSKTVQQFQIQMPPQAGFPVNDVTVALDIQGDEEEWIPEGEYFVYTRPNSYPQKYNSIDKSTWADEDGKAFEPVED